MKIEKREVKVERRGRPAKQKVTIRIQTLNLFNYLEVMICHLMNRYLFL
jgi:hypothetical protein